MSGGGTGRGDGELYLRDVLDIPETVLAGSFKVELSGGFGEAGERIGEYVVTPQLERALRRALRIVQVSVESGKPNGAYLHGSFGSGKSHFMTVLHAILSYHPAARAKPQLQPLLADNQEWLRQRKFLMVPYHLVGSTNLDSAILGGYVATVRRIHPDEPVPPVYRADAMFEDARRQREFFGDDEQFVRWLGNPALPGAAAPAAPDEGDLPNLDVAEAPQTWTTARLDEAFAAAPGDKPRDWLASALLSGPYSSYARGALGAKDAFLPLENGLAIISQHAKDLGYDGLILFLDELILWLQTHLRERTFVNDEVNKLVKLIESGEGERALPIVSFISRQRDLAQLIGEDAIGVEAKNLETQVKYLAERIDTISLEDRNLPAIIRERVLKPKDADAQAALEAAFARVETSNQEVRDVLLDANGATNADWADFRSLYPLSPALLNVLVALSGALQRERTGLRLIQEMLHRRRADMTLGELIPLGDLWDVLAEGMSEAFTDRLRGEADAATRFYTKARAHLVEKYEKQGGEDSEKFRADDRFIKTLLLAHLAPGVPALVRLTGPRLAALNHGSIRSRTGQTDRMAIRRMQELQAAFSGELRSDGNRADPVFSLHLSDLDVEPLLDSVGEKDTPGARKKWVQQWLWRELGLVDTGEFVTHREIVWHGTRRAAEFVFANVRDHFDLPDAQFEPSGAGHIRFVIDYPFDEDGSSQPSADENRVYGLQRSGERNVPTIVWLPSFLSDQRGTQLGRLLKINYLLDRDRLREFATHLSSDDQVRVRHQLEAQREVLSAQLAQVLPQAYGIAKPNESDLGPTVTGSHVHALLPGHTPRLQGGGTFEYNLLKLSDGLLEAMYPKHPNFDRAEERKPLTPAQFRKVYRWIVQAMDDGERRVVVDSGDLALVRRIVHALELGEVHEGPLIVGTEWRRAIDKQAGQHQATGDYRVEDIRAWLGEVGWTGLDKLVGNLLIATYALLADRSWVLRGTPEKAPELDQIGPGWALRAQELPSEEEFAKAHTRAAGIFGTTVPQVLFARNVEALATGVRTRAAEWRAAVAGLRDSLAKHRAALGVVVGDDDGLTPREQSVRDAADLLARIQRDHEAAALARDLASATYLSTDFVLTTTMSTAQEVLNALDGTDWELIDNIRAYTDRGDGLADRAERLLREIASAAADHERDTPLARVLTDARTSALSIIAEAARLGSVAPPAPPLPPPTAPPTAPKDREDRDATGPEITEPEPVVPGTSHPPAVPVPTPTTTRVHRVAPTPTGALETALSRKLATVRAEIAQYAAGHPDAEVEVEIRWQPVSPATDDSTDGSTDDGEGESRGAR